MFSLRPEKVLFFNPFAPPATIFPMSFDSPTPKIRLSLCPFLHIFDVYEILLLFFLYTLFWLFFVAFFFLSFHKV